MARKGRKDRGLFSKRNAAGVLLWYVRLCHEGKERQFGSVKTKTEAREFYEKAKQEQKLGQFFPERYQKGGFAKLEQVLEEHLAAFRGKSLRDEKRFARMWNRLFPNIRLNGISASGLKKARTILLEGGREQATVNRYMAFIRKVLNVAVAEGRMASNPMDQLKMFKESTGATRFLSLEEEQILCDGLGSPYAKWVRLALLTGMRRKEQFSLHRDHVDLLRGVITLPTTKAGVVQYVRLNAEARVILQELEDEALKADAVAEAEAIAEKRPTGKKRSIWVFPSENPRTHISPESFYRRLYLPKVKELGLQGVTWHTLRHTFASRLAMAGVSPVTIAALLRHSDITLVKRYAHLDPSHLKDEIEKASSFGKTAPLLRSPAKPIGADIQGSTEDLPSLPDGDLSVGHHTQR